MKSQAVVRLEMRESFDSLFSIIYYYYFLKANVGTMPGTFPSEDKIRGMDVYMNPNVQRAIKEDKMAFIGDVDLFLDKCLQWYEKEIFLLRIPAFGDEVPFSLISFHIQVMKRKNPILKTFPKSLSNRGYMSYVFKQSVKKGFIYFKKKGYLVKKEIIGGKN